MKKLGICLVIALSLLVISFSFVNANSTGQVYFNDFDGPPIVAPGVTDTLGGITTTESVQGYMGYGNGGNTFGGDFLRNMTGGYASSEGEMGTPGSPTTLTLTGLPSHTSIDLNFLLAILDSWDEGGGDYGPDILTVMLDGNIIFSGSFGFWDPSYDPAPGVLLTEYTPLGFNPYFDDSAYDMGLLPSFDDIPHTASDLTIEWVASGGGWQGADDESWAIDNLEIVLKGAVEIDIKPGIESNNLYCSRGELVRRGIFDVAIITNESFNATSVDHTTVTFEGASEIHIDPATGVPHRHEVDVDRDGDIDLVFHFRLGDTDLNCDSTEGVLIGETFDGIAIRGADSVRMVNYGRSNACGTTSDSAGVSCQDIRDRCPGASSGELWIAPDGTTPILAYCHMDDEGNGWTLIYNRNNAYFSPDHMYHELSAQGPDFSTNSTSWFIPNDATRWRWEVSVDGGVSYRSIETSIPPEARVTTHATVENAPISAVYENTTGASGPFFFQTIVFEDRCRFSCHSGSASWWGIVNVSQGAGDQENPGLGGHTDSCSMDSMLLPGDNYTWGDGNLEYYLSDWKDIGGDGIGGTNCNPFFPTTQYRYRFWAR